MTREKAMEMYEIYYHKKVLALLKRIEKETGENKNDYYYDASYKAKKQYSLIL